MDHPPQRLDLTTTPSPSPIYRALRWGYQPIKNARRAILSRAWKHRTRGIIANYLAQAGFKGLHAGCGPFHMTGWLNSDLLGSHAKADFPLDLTEPLPFPDRSLDVIYSAEVIEHISLAAGRKFLAEAARVLRPGGVLRLTTPDLVECCRLFLNQRDDVSLEHFRKTWLDGPFSPEIWINAQFQAYGHQHLWSFSELSHALQAAGFDKVVRCAPMQSHSPFEQLKNLETRYGENAPAWLFARTMIVEATSPQVVPQLKISRQFTRLPEHADATH